MTLIFRLSWLKARSEKSSGKIITEEIWPLDNAFSAPSESLNSFTLKGKDLDIALIAWVEIKGKEVLESKLTIPSLKFDEIFSGSLGAVRLNIEKINENLEILKTSTYSQGRRFEVIELEMSYKRLIPNDDEPSSYINFYIANGGIVMPSFDDEKADKKAQNIIKSVFPKRKILALNGIDISLGGGNIHCITQQQPLSIQQWICLKNQKNTTLILMKLIFNICLLQ